jgi:serine/threonine protein kinase
VTSRWYRSPEVILMEPYGSKIDIWAVGCIFAELLIASRYSSAFPIFRGTSCYPFSPISTSRGNIIGESDQLREIVRIIGRPKDLAFLEKPSAR